MKIKKIQERCFQIILDNHESNYNALMQKSVKSTIEVKRLQNLAIGNFKTLNNQNPSFMTVVFYQYPQQNLFVQSHKTAGFGYKILKKLDSQMCSSLPEKIKVGNKLSKF